MDKPNWALVLQEIYSNTNSITHSPDEIQYSNPLIQNTGLTKSEVKEALSFLDSHDLIDYQTTEWENCKAGTRFDTPITEEIELTKKGFDVAHERELNSRQLETNFSVAFLTWALVTVGIIEAIQKIGGPMNAETSIYALLALLGITFVATWHIFGEQASGKQIIRNLRKKRTSIRLFISDLQTETEKPINEQLEDQDEGKKKDLENKSDKTSE
ncbi:hypothetical protein [Halorussus pelagicus]|uniref:hypothetical protein n=1 Tax=Halorussus pelagicus TaxID=2505977 RepID=UPI000FFBBFEF|nr:hypothetical protein [Halorussus pelagicus]